MKGIHGVLCGWGNVWGNVEAVMGMYDMLCRVLLVGARMYELISGIIPSTHHVGWKSHG